MRITACTLALLFMGASCASPTETTHVTLVGTPDSIALERGNGVQLEVRAVDANGRDLPRGDLKYAVDDSRVAWVSAAGFVHTLGKGTTVLSVWREAVRKTIALSVTDTAESIPFDLTSLPGPASAWPGDSMDLWSAVRNKWGEPVPGRTGVTWTSSNAAAASVDDSGHVRAISPGTATITAAIGNVRQFLALTVQDSTPFIEGTKRLVPGAELDLRAWTLNHETRTMHTANAVWTSSDPAVVTVTNDGVATGVGNGTATVTAAALPGTVVSTTLTVAALTGTIAYRRSSLSLVSFIALDGSAPVDVDVAEERTMGQFALSPDGSQLAYECGLSVCRYNLADRSTTRIAAAATDPSWTADGKTIGVQTKGAFATLSPNGGPLALVHVAFYVAGPRIAGDGSGFLYECNLDDPYDDNGDMCYADLSGATQKLVAKATTEFAWSPTGDSIAFVRTLTYPAVRTYEERLCVSTRSAECDMERRNTCFAFAWQPAWSTDGRYLVFAKNGFLWISDPAGNVCMRLAQAKLESSSFRASPSWGKGAKP